MKLSEKHIKTIKGVIGVAFAIMVAIDVVLVFSEDDGYPTFSWVVRDNRTDLIWLTFLFGGLVSKIFYNRQVMTKEPELNGFMAFAGLVFLLFFLGGHLECVTSWDEGLVLIAGGLLAHGLWPQYKKAQLQ